MCRNIDQSFLYNIAKSLRIFSNRGELFSFSKGYPEKIEPDNLKILIRQCVPHEQQPLIRDSKISEVIKSLRSDPDLQFEFCDIQTDAQKIPVNLVPLKNGWFDLFSGTLVDASEQLAQRPFSFLVDANYISKDQRNSPVAKDFVESSFPISSRYDETAGFEFEITEEKKEQELSRKLLLQSIAATVSQIIFKKSFWFIGKPDSGKSVWCEFLRDSIKPQSAVSSTELDRLDAEFSRSKLAKAQVNILTETKMQSLKADGTFKQIVAGETITVREKYKPEFEQKFKVKLLTAGNYLPEFKNSETRSLINRLQILYFPVSIPFERQDQNLLAKLNSERDSIWSDALDALHLMLKEGQGFAMPKKSLEIITDLMWEDVDYVMDLFKDAYLATDKAGVVLTRDLKAQFDQFLRDNALNMDVKVKTLVQSVRSMPGVKPYRATDGSNLRGVQGVKLKPHNDKEIERLIGNFTVPPQINSTQNAQCNLEIHASKFQVTRPSVPINMKSTNHLSKLNKIINSSGNVANRQSMTENNKNIEEIRNPQQPGQELASSGKSEEPVVNPITQYRKKEPATEFKNLSPEQIQSAGSKTQAYLKNHPEQLAISEKTGKLGINPIIDLIQEN